MSNTKTNAPISGQKILAKFDIDFSSTKAIAAARAERGFDRTSMIDAEMFLSKNQFRAIERALRSVAKALLVDLEDVTLDINEGQGRRPSIVAK